jgi:hypothetical protein
MAKPLVIPNLFGSVTTASTVNLDADFTAVAAAINDPLTYAVYAVDSGAANAYVITLAPAPATQAALLGVPVTFKAANANTTASTLNPNALGAQNIVNRDGSALVAGQIPVSGIATVVWDGTNYQLQSASPPAGNAVVPVRQTALMGALTSAGYANFLSAGAALNFNISATATPLVLTFAGGFGSTGNVDYLTRITADASNQGSLAARQTNFITATYVSSSSVTWGSTVIPLQYGYAFDQTAQELLRWPGTNGSATILSDYGNTWTATGATVSTGTLIDGGNTLAVNGTGQYVESSSFTTLGGGSWTWEFKFRWGTLPIAGQTQVLLNAGQSATNFGILLGLNNTAATIKTTLSLSSNTTSADIVSLQLGTKTVWATATTYHFALTYDALAGAYFLYVDGTQDGATVTTASRICGIAKVRYGEAIDATLQQANGNFGWSRMNRSSAYPFGTAFTPTTSIPSVTGDFFSIPQMTMYGSTAASGVAGTNPTLTAKNVVYVGESDTGAATVTATRNYAYKGQYVSADTAIPAVGTRTGFAANIGCQVLAYPTAYMRNYIAEGGYTPGMIVPMMIVPTAGFVVPAMVPQEDRNTLSIVTGGSAATQIINRTTGVLVASTSANWKMFVTAQRGF